MSKNWYSIKNSGTSTASISIHDEVGLWGVSAKDFLSDLSECKNVAHIDLSIHSPGGNVFDGLAIYNALKNHPAKVTARVDGLAASIASVIIMAADVITMPSNAYLMIHNTHGGAYGGSDDLREMADLMDKLAGTIRNIYSKRTGIAEDRLVGMMDSETWMTGIEARDLGFADVVLDEVDIAAKAGNYAKYFRALPINSAPKKIDSIATVRDLEAYLRDAGGLSRSDATGIVAIARGILQRDADNHADRQALDSLQARLSGLAIPKSLLN